MLFLIPGHGDTLRVSGKGRIVRDRVLQERLAVAGKVPAVVLVITVEQAFMHCPKSMLRSRLWQPQDWPDRTTVPSLAEAIVVHAVPPETPDEVRAIVDEANARLY